jgi:hypothetical protein
MQAPNPMHAAMIAMHGGMNNGGKVSLFHVFRANVLTLYEVNCSCQDIRESRFTVFKFAMRPEFAKIKCSKKFHGLQY